MTWVATATLAVTAYTSHEASKTNNALSEQNRDAAVVSQTYDNRSLNEQLRQEEELNADKKLELRLQALNAESTMQASERGVAGTSVDRQSQEVSNMLGLAIQQINDNEAGSRNQLEMSKKGTTAQAQSRINSMPKTSYNPMADIAKTGLSIYGGFGQAKSAAKANDLKQPSFTDYAFGDWK
ncbi:virion core protein, T7 gp14 family [Amphritea sp. HPY]|uniref:virion core protein, T7 gp14 family n=1 Tax=Amphritea sp. HPY TaxID=3421652 RepID=UPI003D7CF065